MNTHRSDASIGTPAAFAQFALALGGSFAAALVRLDETIGRWHTRARDRRALASLDDRMLLDVGLTRADVQRESAKLFWQE
jgi:uncharacterized protein YjiS (DUF1127 family)